MGGTGVAHTEMRDQDRDSDYQTSIQFLRLCLRGRWEPAALEAALAQSASGHVDWHAVCQVAQREGLAPLLHHVARNWGAAAGMPAAVDEELHRAYMGTARRNTILFNELERILPTLASAGVSVLLLKGAALAQAVYGNIAVRPMADLDLLVREKDVPAALRALPALGYEIIPPLVYRSEVMLERHVQAERVLVELHWSPLVHPYYHYSGLIDWAWQSALPISLGQTSAWTLGPEAQLLHLCGHLLLHHAGEGETRQLWLHDLAEVTSHYRETIDWDELLAGAQQYGLVLPAQCVPAEITQDWPAAVVERLRRLQASPNEQCLHARLVSGSRTGIKRLWADLAALPGRGPQLDFAWRNLFPPAGYMQACYRIPHRLLVSLYYPYRWFLALHGLV